MDILPICGLMTSKTGPLIGLPDMAQYRAAVMKQSTPALDELSQYEAAVIVLSQTWQAPMSKYEDTVIQVLCLKSLTYKICICLSIIYD